MTDKPEIMAYDSIIDLNFPLHALYGDKIPINCTITIEYVGGDKPKFFRTGRLEFVKDDATCSYVVHQKRYDAFEKQASKAHKKLIAFAMEGGTIDDAYTVYVSGQSHINQSVNSFCSYLTLDESASVLGVFSMNCFIESSWFTSKFVLESFYMMRHENGQEGFTVLQFNPQGFEAKYIHLVDAAFYRGQMLDKLNTIKKRKEDKKTGHLTPQHKQQDYLVCRPDILSKGFLGSKGNINILFVTQINAANGKTLGR